MCHTTYGTHWKSLKPSPRRLTRVGMAFVVRYDRLKNGTLDEARYAVSMIVGRDTQSLTEEGVTKAAVETVAENASAVSYTHLR